MNYVTTTENNYRTRTEEEIERIITGVSKDCSNIFSTISMKIPHTAFNSFTDGNQPNKEVRLTSKPIIDLLSFSIINNNYIDGVYVYSPDNNWLISHKSFHINYELSDNVWYYDGITEDIKTQEYWSAVLKNPHNNNDFIAIYKTSAFEDLTVITVNLTNLKNEINRLFSNSKASRFAVWNVQNNTLVFSTGDSDDLLNMYQNYSSQENFVFFKNKFSYNSFDIMEYNWKCIFEYDNSQSLKEIYSSFLLIIPLSIILLLIVSAFIAYCRAKKVYLPIKEMITVLDNPKNIVQSSNFVSHFQDSEIKYIMETILKNIQDKNIIQLELENNLELLNEANKYALQIQIAPHFIFNTLEIICLESYNLFGDDNIVSEMICSLSDIMRMTFKNDNKFIKVSTELSYVEKYIYLQSIRYEDLFDVIWDIDESANEFLMPKLTLQPIVENAIVHGIIPSKRHCTLTIRSKHKNGIITFTVEDTGVGMTPEQLNEVRKTLKIVNTIPSQNIGISNVNMRVKLIFGDTYGCNIVSSDKNGTITEIKIPEIFLQQ